MKSRHVIRPLGAIVVANAAFLRLGASGMKWLYSLDLPENLTGCSWASDYLSRKPGGKPFRKYRRVRTSEA